MPRKKNFFEFVNVFCFKTCTNLDTPNPFEAPCLAIYYQMPFRVRAIFFKVA